MLVSEVMLQQTQAARVAEAFPAFLERFPDVDALAGASRAEVLRAWGALGYNRRAVAMHEAARMVVRERDGRIPSGIDELRMLPGVGPYTAAAVASIAFGEPVPAIDTNARRVMARIELGAEPDEVPATSVAQAAAGWLARDRPGDWNQAVMNLGREVCRPLPRCEFCPLAAACRFRAKGRAGAGRSSARRQPAFEGSMRQVRGSVIRELRSRTRAASIAALAGAVAEPIDRVEAAVSALERDGLVERTRAGSVRLAR